MSEFMRAARALIRARDEGAADGDHELIATKFVEAVTFEDPDVIYRDMKHLLREDWMALPSWARNLAFRLACLQKPDDRELLMAAAADLEQFGPDWDGQAAELMRRVSKMRPES
ncbi:hypothetical protein ACFU3J_03175 [Streptomyces sp. NPDC057411]|uniref:hypothetical protein n=1 Tax=unclassified Streptomyces TaxID=2593676 RepID=UPI0036343582